MKKTLLFAAVAALAMGASLWGQTINVTSPGTGDDWCLGSTHTITWTSSGVTGPVSIKLRTPGAPDSPAILTVSASTVNDGAFSWNIPGSLAPGDYIVRVRTVSADPIIYGDSTTFSVAGCITVTAPTGTSKWCIGSSNNILWTSSGVAGPLSIKLRLPGAPDTPPVLDITASTNDDGSFSWTIPGTVTPGWYNIRVRTVSASPLVYDDSPDFEIKDCSGPSITVTRPDATHGWCTGRPGLIQWTASGVMSAFVKIILYTAPYSSGEIGNMLIVHTSNDGEYTWNVPDTQAPGDYVVKVQTTTGSISDFSGTFKIYKCIDPSILDKIKEMKYYYIRIPKWPPEPDPWWKIDFGEFREVMKNKFEGSIFLLKNGQKVKEIGKFGRNTPIPESLKFQMGELNSKSLKDRSAKFSLGVYNAQGELMQETPLEVQVGQQLRH